MMVEAEATTETIELVAGGAQAPTEAVVAQGLEAGEAVHPQPVRGPAGAGRRRRQADREFPTFPAYQPDVLDAVTAQASDDLAAWG